MKKIIISFCLLLFAITTWAQTREITGQILGPDGAPIEGVIVVQQGNENNGAATDMDGKFTLQVPESENVSLVAKYPGYPDKVISVVAGQTDYSVSFEAAQEEEVVAIGYGTVKKSELIGSVASVSAEDVKEVPSQNVVESVQGKVPGADITRTSGETGKAPNIVIRGTRSIAAGNGPLYIVDGVQYSSIQDINPNDIASMEVLKDPSTTAIYGSRGANGVIIITTKRGSAKDGIKVFLNAYTGVSSALTYPRAMTGNEFADLNLAAARVTNPNATYADALNAQQYANYQNGVMTNYTDQLLHNGSQSDIQLGVSGGTDKLRTYFSLDYYKEKGLLKNDELQRYTGRLNLDYNVAKFMKVGTQTQITYYDQSKRANPLGNAAKIDPLTTPFDANGNIIPIPGGKHANPLLDEYSHNSQNDVNTLRIFPTIYAEVTPIKNLTARTNLAVNWDNRKQGIFNSTNSYTLINGADTGPGNFASVETDNRVQLNWQGILTYTTHLFNENHNFSATALSEVITNSQERFYIESRGQVIPEQLYYNLADNTTRSVNSRFKSSKLVSFAGRANYSFKGKYLLTVTGRTDGASVLAEGNKWDFFPSVAGGWVVTEEKFMDGLKTTFNTIKLRGSWGVTGNSNIEPYSTQSTLIKVPFAYDQTGVTAYTFRPTIGNTETTWEKSNTVDLGVDVGLLQDRITITADVYDTKTNDLLLTKKLPMTTGVSETVANVGKTRNKGVELAVTSVNIDKKKFRWTTTLTFMANKERVVALTDGVTTMPVTDLDPDNQSTKTVVVGSPVNSFYDYEKIGIWQVEEKDAAAVYGAVPGNIKIKDQNGDGKITPEDRTVVGSTVPKFSAGLNSEFRILNNFDVSFFFFTRVGQTINYQYTYNPLGGENSLSTREYWSAENHSNDLPGPGLAIDNRFTKTINYVNGSYLKLRSVNIGYTLPNEVSKKFGISRLRIYVTGKNLFVVSKIRNYDPEMQGSLTFPTTRLFIGGVNFEF